MKIQEGDFVIRDFAFHRGAGLLELRLRYRTLGQPARGDHDRVLPKYASVHFESKL